MKDESGFNVNVLILSVLGFFVFSEFIGDIKGFYSKVQSFFFRTSFFALLFPALLIVLGIGYFFLPKVLNASYDKSIFIFLGGFIFTGHLAFIARETKGNSFAGFINYIFIFSILYIINLILLGSYFRIAFSVHIGKIILEGMKNGAALIQYIFTQALN